MEVKQIINNKYSNSYSSLTKVKYSNSTVSTQEVLLNVKDVLHEGYEPFYAKKLNEIGYKRFMELVVKARAGSNNPQRLFSWMLKNHLIVK